jgi:DNA-binding MarR family transcriptional regulator
MKLIASGGASFVSKRLKLREFLPYRLSVLSNRISRDIAKSYQRRFELSIPEWRVMATLGEFGKLSAREVARLTAMDKVAVSRAVVKLARAGRLVRKKDAADRRRTVLALSREGLAIYAKVGPLALAYEGALLKKLGPADRKALDQVLEKLARVQQTIRA